MSTGRGKMISKNTLVLPHASLSQGAFTQLSGPLNQQHLGHSG